ncbi:hypothetical protein CERSUDRAFT_92961 [Gelatoporia subvermispora B]|uniref:C3H1-type domain-containing protein n=1 Tax=Ceriporiopsis subvermispora (strain B) TaxID=914234 RepID=M2R336_CERS8|nr:hypothetical protein CERSUDRAFT_92961 [Gelatoporia subvermispora B]
MDSPSTSAAALKLEIERLTGAINRHKTGAPTTARAPAYTARPRNNVYVNPNYKPLSKSAKPTPPAPQPPAQAPPSVPPTRPLSAAEKRDVVIAGVTFESSARSLVRKDLAKPPSAHKLTPPTVPHTDFRRTKAGALMNNARVYKPKVSRRGRPTGRNMTLNNSRRPYQSRRLSTKRAKYVDKPCPRFTTTGACNRGLTCPYQHDPAKIAICWNFLQGNCPNTAETCPLSHDPTPERTPLCVHFANNGRCTRANCPFPHVRVGQRDGVCRDFAVLGYCEKGLDCDKQHIRECPDFAEKGACTTKGCKLPHVIRANRNRKAAATVSSATISGDSGSAQSSTPALTSSVESGAGTNNISSAHPGYAEDAQLGDEFISLTFHESESDDDESDEEDDDEEEAEDGEEGSEPHSDDAQVEV